MIGILIHIITVEMNQGSFFLNVMEPQRKKQVVQRVQKEEAIIITQLQRLKCKQEELLKIKKKD